MNLLTMALQLNSYDLTSKLQLLGYSCTSCGYAAFSGGKRQKAGWDMHGNEATRAVGSSFRVRLVTMLFMDLVRSARKNHTVF